MFRDTPDFPWPQRLFHTEATDRAAASIGSSAPFVAKAAIMRGLSAKIQICTLKNTLAEWG